MSDFQQQGINQSQALAQAIQRAKQVSSHHLEEEEAEVGIDSASFAPIPKPDRSQDPAQPAGRRHSGSIATVFGWRAWL